MWKSSFSGFLLRSIALEEFKLYKNIYLDHILPTENRVRDEKSSSVIEVLKISEMPSLPDNRAEMLHSEPTSFTGIKNQQSKKNAMSSTRESSVKNNSEFPTAMLQNHNNTNKKIPNNTRVSEPMQTTHSLFNGDATLEINVNTDDGAMLSTSGSSSPVEVMQFINERLDITTNISNMKRKLPKTSGVCTQSSSTSGPSRVAVSSQTEKTLSTSNIIAVQSDYKGINQKSFPTVSSVAVTTSAQVTTTFSDPRMEIRNIAPPEVRRSNNDSHWDEETGK